MFQQRQINEFFDLEMSVTPAVSPGSIADTALVHATQACVLGGTSVPATFANGDILEVLAPASAALNGVVVEASPSATAGTCNLVFRNNTGGAVTPTASTKYTILAWRPKANVIS